MDIPLYKYEPLSGPDEIRVLELSATKRRIETRIIHVPVSSRSFQALSYVWGEPDLADEAFILDKLGIAFGKIPLTKNLGNALRDLRDTNELESKVFWIDQICINQSNKMEKNHQVAMMSQICTQSRRVITYCGPGEGDEKEERGIRLLKRICENISTDTWHQMHKTGSLELIRDKIFDGSIQLERLPSDLDLVADGPYDENEISKRYAGQGWDWLVHVAYGEWTQRLWIVQEQLLNKEIITLRGHRLVDWDFIMGIPILFAISHLPQQYRDIGRRDLRENSLSWYEIDQTLYGIWWDRHARLKSGTSYNWSPLCHNLQWYQSLLCQDARDRVYALLAISRDAEVLGLKPDYSPLNTVDALSKQLSIAVLENAVNLELLSFAFSWNQPNSTLPSWCLQLDRPANIDAPENSPVDVYTPHPKPYGCRLARFDMDNSILAVKGRVVDYVSTPGSIIAWHHDDTSKTLHIEFLSSLLYLLPDGFAIEDIASLLRTITARAPWSPSPDAEIGANETTAFHFWAYLRHRLRLLAECDENSPATPMEMLEHCDRIMTKLRTSSTSNVVHSELYLTDNISREEDIATEKLLPYILEQGRRLGRTRAGRFCNALYTVQEGDSILALQGADQLFIIRPVENTTFYRLIGDIFVDGLMHGEAYENQDPNTVDYEITLA